MNKKHFVKSFQLPTLTLKLAGLYLNYPKSMDWVQYFKWSWFFYFNMQSLSSDTFGEIIWFVEGAKSGKSFVELTFNAPCVIFSILACFKMYFIFINKKVVTDIMAKLHDMYPEDTAEEDIKKIANDSTSFYLNTIVTITFYLNCVLVWLFNLFPLAYTVNKYMSNGEVVLLLPYLIWYPFNQFDIKIWPIIYVRQMWSGILSVVGLVGPDTLYYACCSHIRMHFRILQYRLERSVARTVDQGVRSQLKSRRSPEFDADRWNFNINSVKVDNEELRTIFVGLVQEHQDLIGLVNRLELLYSKSTLINFVSSSILICLTGFNVMAIQPSQLPVFAVFFVSCLSQIFIFCLFGDMITQSSVQVSNAIYHSHWYLADMDTRKMMLFSLTRSQKACKLTAFNFADVNLNSFTSIMSTSWSYFALLNTVYSPNH